MPLTVILATAGYDHKLRYWDANTGNCTKTTKFEESQVNALEIAPNKYYLAAAGNPNIHLFDVNSASDTPVITFEGHSGNVTDIGFQQDTQWLYSCSEDGTIKIWDLRAPEAQRTYDCQCAIHSSVLHPDQATILSADQNGFVKTWDLLAGDKFRNELSVSSDAPIRSLAISNDASMVIAAAHKGTLHVLQTASPDKEYEIITSFEAHNDYLLRAAISPDMCTVATSSADNTIRIWDPTNNWSLVRTLKQHQRWVWDVTFSADSSFLVSASSDQSSKLWDLRNGEVIRNYVGHSLAVTCVALNDSNIS